jgi:hypothetical protein
MTVGSVTNRRPQRRRSTGFDSRMTTRSSGRSPTSIPSHPQKTSFRSGWRMNCPSARKPSTPHGSPGYPRTSAPIIWPARTPAPGRRSRSGSPIVTTADPRGAGFAAGDALDRLAPGPLLARELDGVIAAGYDGLTDSEQIGVLLGWQRQAAWAQAGLAAAVIGVRNWRLTQADLDAMRYGAMTTRALWQQRIPIAA